MNYWSLGVGAGTLAIAAFLFLDLMEATPESPAAVNAGVLMLAYGFAGILFTAFGYAPVPS